MTILDLLQDKRYKKKAILEKLICHRLDLTKEGLFIDGEKEVDEASAVWIDESYQQYTVEKKPLEYILWYVEFSGIRFKVNNTTLIPRPETEYMIEAVREYIWEKKTDLWFNLVDIGTWCWVLGLANTYHHWADLMQVVLSELNEETLEVAKSNYASLFADRDHPEVQFLASDLCQHEVVQNILKETNTPSLLVANLPYIPDELFDTNTDETVQKREPRMAFVWWDDGCDLYRRMFDQIIVAKKQEKNAALTTMFLEMMTWQADVLRQEYPQWTFDEVKTFHFNIRIVRVEVGS